MSKKNKKEKDNQLFLALTAVALIIVLAGGGTYAWWTWVSANNTIVNIEVAGGTYTLDGGGNITSGQELIPTDECNHSTYSIRRTIVANTTNDTTTDMVAYVQLKPSTFPSAFKQEELEWVLTTSSTSCTSDIVASGNFSDVTQGTAFNLTSFDVPAETTTALTKTYYLYIWLNEEYTYKNTGSTVSDPIQNKSFTLELTGEMTNEPIA